MVALTLYLHCVVIQKSTDKHREKTNQLSLLIYIQCMSSPLAYYTSATIQAFISDKSILTAIQIHRTSKYESKSLVLLCRSRKDRAERKKN